MARFDITKSSFGGVYPLYIAKAEKKVEPNQKLTKSSIG